MGNSVNLIGFGTFGNPNGFKQTFFAGSTALENSIKTFDLNTNAIKLFPNSNLFSIRKEYVSGVKTIAYSKYSYAKEQNSDRSGTFIGSSVLYANYIADEALTVELLNEFHSILIKNNIKNDTIMVNHSNKLSVLKPKSYDNIERTLKEIDNLDFLKTSGKNLVVFCTIDIVEIGYLFSKSIDLLNIYDTIYFTDNQDIAEYVYSKGIFKIIQNVGDKLDFEKEVQEINEEKARKIKATISDFEREIARLSVHKNDTIIDFKQQIEESERIHRENELKINEAKKNIEVIEKLYNEFQSNVNELARQIRKNKRLDDVKLVYIENKNRFIDSLNSLKKPNYVNVKNIPKSKPKTNLVYESKNRNNVVNISNKNVQHDTDVQNDKKQDIFKYLTVVFFLLLGVTWAFYFYQKREMTDTAVQNESLVTPLTQEEINNLIQTDTLVIQLKPLPNSKLSDKEYRAVAKKLRYNMKLDDVIKKIFDMNKNDIKKYYDGQDSIYAKILIDSNKNCFVNANGIVYFQKDTLRIIPIFK